jgi:AbrB family looped-hinge helix DNA binding protein
MSGTGGACVRVAVQGCIKPARNAGFSRQILTIPVPLPHECGVPGGPDAALVDVGRSNTLIGISHKIWQRLDMSETTVQIDRAGRLVLPKRLRDRFRLRGGDTLAVEVRGDAIELRPTQGLGQLRRINGVLVFTGPRPFDSSRDLVAESRENRIHEVMQGVKGQR